MNSTDKDGRRSEGMLWMLMKEKFDGRYGERKRYHPDLRGRTSTLTRT